MDKKIQIALFSTFAVIMAFNYPAFSEEIKLDNSQQTSSTVTQEQNLTTDKAKDSTDTESKIIEVQDLKGTIRATEEESKFKLWLNGDHATGDLGGLRSKLQEKGVSFNVQYYNDNFMKAYGGINNNNNIRYHGFLDMSADLDTKQAGLWPGGKFHIRALNKHGSTLTQRDTGDLQYYDNTDLTRNMLLSEYWLEQGFFSDRLKVKVGKQNASYDFDTVYSCFNMLNVSKGLIPTIPLPSFTNPGLGITTTVSPTNWFSIKTGFFDGGTNPEVKSFRTAFDGNDGALTIIEPKITHSIKGYPGTYLAGFWYHSGDQTEITSSANARSFSGAAGYYSSFEQMIFKENKIDDQGITLHTQFGWAPSDRRYVSRYYGTGVHYKGLIPKRNKDILGIGTSIARLSGRQKAIDGKTGESVLELFYIAQVTPWLAVQPDMQFIFNPGGKGKDTMAFGVRTLITF